MRQIGIILFCLFVSILESNCRVFHIKPQEVTQKFNEIPVDLNFGVRNTYASPKYKPPTKLSTDYNCSVSHFIATKAGDTGTWDFEDPTTFQKCSYLTILSQTGLWLNINITMGNEGDGNLQIKGVPSGNMLFESRYIEFASFTDAPDTQYYIIISGAVTFNLNFEAVRVCAVLNCSCGACAVNAENQPFCSCSTVQPLKTTTTSTRSETTSSETSTTTFVINTTKPPSTSQGLSKTTKIIFAVSAAFLLIIVAVCVIIFCYRRIRNQQSLIKIIVKEHEISDKDKKDLAKTADQFQLSSNKISVYYDQIIGSGSTATVYKGFLHGNCHFNKNFKMLALNEKYSNCNVAIKIPKEMNQSQTEQIMRELQAMRQIGYHSHIAVLLGWCFQNDLPSLVFEFAKQDLYKYICKFRQTPNSCMPLNQMLKVAWQISVGMEYIASFNMVHRDLAARNILLYDGFHAKISDFGLCCHCDESFTYQATLNKKLPVRWLSIEALVDRKFSEKSDVWAFGVLLYEMCTNGSVPYTLLSNYDIVEFLKSGKRLEKPEITDTKVYDLMLDCWKESLNERLTFAAVTLRLHNQLEEETQAYGYLSMTSEQRERLYS